MRRNERRHGWTLAILVVLIGQLTQPASDDVEELLGVLGLVFPLGFIGLVGASVLAARYLLSSSALRVLTILAGPLRACSQWMQWCVC